MCHLATRPAVPRDWFRGVPERYVAGADTRGRQEGQRYPWSQQVIHEISGLNVYPNNRFNHFHFTPTLICLKQKKFVFIKQQGRASNVGGEWAFQVQSAPRQARDRQTAVATKHSRIADCGLRISNFKNKDLQVGIQLAKSKGR